MFSLSLGWNRLFTQLTLNQNCIKPLCFESMQKKIDRNENKRLTIKQAFDKT